MVNLAEINQKELQEFWEWCGWTNNGCYWFEPTEFGGNRYAPHGDKYNQVPPIDLNNLFKYAEKSLVDYFIKTTHTEEKYRLAYYNFLCEWLFDYIWNEPHNPAQALYQAIQKARRKE